MDRELLLELGLEEIPASWLPGLTQQIGLLIQNHGMPARVLVLAGDFSENSASTWVISASASWWRPSSNIAA